MCRRGRVPLPRRPEGLSRARDRRARAGRPTRSSPARSRSPAATARSNGRSPGSAASRTASSTPIATPFPTPEGGTHESGLRIALLRGLQRPRRARRAGQARQRGDDRRRHGDLRGHALGVHPRAGVPGPDQGQARHRWRPRASSRTRSATPSTTGWPPPRPRPTSCWTGASTAPRSGCAGAPRRRSPARLRCASCACPASWRTARRRARRVPSSSSSRAIRPAAPPSRRATAQTQAVLPLRGKILNVANATRDKLAANQQLVRPRAGAGLRHGQRTTATRSCATRRSSS